MVSIGGSRCWMGSQDGTATSESGAEEAKELVSVERGTVGDLGGRVLVIGAG
jgi:hypothetical protein